jgi:hypothetical protein
VAGMGVRAGPVRQGGRALDRRGPRPVVVQPARSCARNRYGSRLGRCGRAPGRDAGCTCRHRNSGRSPPLVAHCGCVRIRGSSSWNDSSSIGWFTPLFNARRRPFVRHLEPRQPRITGRLDAKAIAVRPPWSVALDVFKPVSGSGGGGNDPRAEETPAAKAPCVWQERVGIRQGRIGRDSSPCPMRRRSHGRTSPSRHRMRRPPRGLGAGSSNRRRGRRRWRST